jgi:hypothetical protein
MSLGRIRKSFPGTADVEEFAKRFIVALGKLFFFALLPAVPAALGAGVSLAKLFFIHIFMN